MSFYISTAIPYVNGDPHLGFALECVQADVLARHRRLRGEHVRFVSGTDDNSLKNVHAAEAAGVAVAAFVASKAQRFRELRGPLQLSDDDFVRTSVDPRHKPGVQALWRACAQRGDLYARDYEGLYCNGCEAFLSPGERGCAEHAEAPVRVAERNWFFRLSRYEDALLELSSEGRLRIEPAHRRNEVLSFIRGGLADFSVSRSQARARGWGIPVPGDPSQIVYVWFDALAYYVTALGYGSGGERYGPWWERSAQRVHVIGKGITRFHAVYWPAILLSAGAALPTDIFVHDYLTVNGSKISKSAGDGAWAPDAVAARFGGDALRWWFVRDVPRSGDVDFREELVAARANELADGLGNLVNRTIALVARWRPEGVVPSVDAAALIPAIGRTPSAIDRALERFDLRAGAAAIWELVDDANRFVERTRPWELARNADRGLDDVLGALVLACRTLARELAPFLPAAAERIEHALERGDPQAGRRLFAKVEVVTAGA